MTESEERTEYYLDDTPTRLHSVRRGDSQTGDREELSEFLKQFWKTLTIIRGGIILHYLNKIKLNKYTETYKKIQEPREGTLELQLMSTYESDFYGVWRLEYRFNTDKQNAFLIYSGDEGVVYHQKEGISLVVVSMNADGKPSIRPTDWGRGGGNAENVAMSLTSIAAVISFAAYQNGIDVQNSETWSIPIKDLFSFT